MKKQDVQRKLFLLITSLAFIPFISFVSAQTNPQKRVKVALVYTVTTPELKADVVREVKMALGEDVELLSYEEPEVFEEPRRVGYVTAKAAAKLIGTYMRAIEEGADAILSICSTVADVGYAMQDAAEYLGVPVVMINDGMCREAIKRGTRIAVMATFPTAIAPTTNTLHRLSREMGRQIEVVEVLVEGGFGLDQEKFKALMARKAGEVAGRVDVILFAQGSMAYCEEYIAKMYNKPTLSNPRFGAQALKAALVDKGLME